MPEDSNKQHQQPGGQETEEHRKDREKREREGGGQQGNR